MRDPIRGKTDVFREVFRIERASLCRGVPGYQVTFYVLSKPLGAHSDPDEVDVNSYNSQIRKMRHKEMK